MHNLDIKRERRFDTIILHSVLSLHIHSLLEMSHIILDVVISRIKLEFERTENSSSQVEIDKK